jgi:hypothetical protein
MSVRRSQRELIAAIAYIFLPLFKHSSLACLRASQGWLKR